MKVLGIFRDGDCNVTFFSKFDRIWLEIQKNLNYSLFIVVNKILLKVELAPEQNTLCFSLLLLNTKYFFNCFSDIKVIQIDSKLSRFYLSIIQQILNKALHQLWGRLLNLLSFLQLIKYLFYLKNLICRLRLLHYHLHFWHQTFILQTLRTYWIQWIS